MFFLFCFFFSVRTVEFCTTLVCKRVAKAPFTVASVDAVVIGTVCCSTDVNRTQKKLSSEQKKKCLFKHSKVLCR